ncbi:MAG: bifunctional glutamate N-acetyltransferase/amino-acid acetyltransferase ArgJ [Coriobacteriales bacterium]|jgi:glutamate N-acetyltransferase/amino-acid N-acetyltransferase|nr:bifunctional glutamate N-acetyltransferase/amino-acid acetyltransferase ArgJ [Coriobacteriales bacterium]
MAPAQFINEKFQKEEGGLGAVKGLHLAGIWAGFRKKPGRRDLALIVAPPHSTAAGVFTQSNFAAAPVLISRSHLAAQADDNNKSFRALVINSGNANAATGQPGKEVAHKVCALTAEALDCSPEEILVASTGVIGVQLPYEKFSASMPQAIAELSVADTLSKDSAELGATDALSKDDSSKGIHVAEAIMTTDTVPKVAALSFTATTQEGKEVAYTVGGMAKGSGMIAPHMATMIAVMATDARIEQQALSQALKEAVGVSFNKVTIDSDTSTNDSAYLLATGAASQETILPGSEAFEAFKQALVAVCQDLAYQIAKDGEGATKVIVVEVTGAANDEDAELVARAIADSPLVKTAIAGHDANWGRIAMAAGKAGASFKQEAVHIAIMDLEVMAQGTPLAFSEEEAARRFDERDEVFIAIDLGAGQAQTRIWTCDLTKEYVAINGDYRT